MAKKRAAEIKRLAETLGKQATEGTKETPPPPEGTKETPPPPDGTKEMPPPPVPKKKAKAAKPPVPPEDSEQAEKPQKKRKTPPKGTGGEKPKDGDVVKTDPPKAPKDAELKKYETVDSKGKKTLRAPDFPITWDNHHRLMDFYTISEEEATTILLQVVGPHPNGQAFWDRFRAKPNGDSVDEDRGNLNISQGPKRNY